MRSWGYSAGPGSRHASVSPVCRKPNAREHVFKSILVAVLLLLRGTSQEASDPLLCRLSLQLSSVPLVATVVICPAGKPSLTHLRNEKPVSAGLQSASAWRANGDRTRPPAANSWSAGQSTRHIVQKSGKGSTRRRSPGDGSHDALSDLGRLFTDCGSGGRPNRERVRRSCRAGETEVGSLGPIPVPTRLTSNITSAKCPQPSTMSE